MDSILEQIPEALAREISALGLRHDGETLWVGLPSSIDQQERESTRQQLQNRLGTKIGQVPVEDSLLHEVLDTIYAVKASDEFTPRTVASGDSEGPIADLVNEILDRAVRLRASDIHVEPTESELVIRARVDGQLETIVRMPGNLAASFISRLKVLAKINIVERRRPQDGQFSIQIDDRQIDCRLATVATLYGEKAVMRLLDTNRTLTTLQGLGMGALAVLPGAVGKAGKGMFGRAVRKIDELTGLPLNPDGTVTVYHHTSAANAANIKKQRVLRSAGEP
ncbi:MAG: hypothetical protein RL454_744, partial [Actinomycetota bacterium]